MDESRSIIRSKIFDEKWCLVVFDINLGDHDLWRNTVSIDWSREIIRLSPWWKSNESTNSLSRWNVNEILAVVSFPICSSSSFQLIESCWIFKESLRPTFTQICERLRRFIYGSSPIDYSDLDYVDYPPISSPSTSDFPSTTILPLSTSGIASDSNSRSHLPTTGTSSSSLS